MKRLCHVCDQLFNPDDAGMEVLQDFAGKTTIRDSKTGLVHVLVSQGRTNRWLAKQQAQQEPKIEVVLRPQKAGEVEAPSPSIEPVDVFEKLVRAVEDEIRQRVKEQLPQPQQAQSEAHPVEVDVSLVQEPEWVPLPTEWYTATIIKTPASDFFYGELTNGGHVLCFRDRISNAPNGHVCLPQIGDDVAVRLAPHQGMNAQTRWDAVEVSLQREYEIPALPESATIRHWNDGRGGKARRDCGCSIHVHLRFDGIALEKGDRVEVSEYAIDEKGRLEAHAVQPLWGSPADEGEDL